MQDRPAFIDFESSGLSVDSYPIEAGVALAGEEAIASWLIRPTEEWQRAGEWDEIAETTIHGISQGELRSAGVPPHVVALNLNHLLQSCTAYCDGYERDRRWMDRLFEAAGMKPAFRLRPIEELLAATVLKSGLDKADAIEVIGRIRQEEEERGRRHRAGPDAAGLRSLYERVLSELTPSPPVMRIG